MIQSGSWSPSGSTLGENEGSLGGRLAVHRGIFQFGEWFPIWSTAHGFSAIGDPQVSWNAEQVVLDLRSTTRLGIDAVAATGVLQSGATDDHWVFEAQNVRDFAFTVNPAYRVATRQIECEGRSTEIRAYVDRASSSMLLQWTTEAMNSYGGWFGCYTYPVFSVAEVGSPHFSMEFPNIVFIATGMISAKRNVVHEIAHQWWYGMVGNDQIEQPWVDEAFAEYSELLLIGGWSYCSTKPVTTPIYEFTSWSGCDGYYETVYHQGAAFLKEVRERMGDGDFFGALKEIVSEHRYGVATTTAVLDIFRAESATPLDDLIVQFGLSTT